MPVVVSFVSQKGGVGKSTLARALAVMLAPSGLRIRIADLDTQQETTKRWADKRNALDLKYPTDARLYNSSREAFADSDDVDILIIDGPARATKDTIAIAGASHIVVQPSGATTDDLQPAAALYQILEENGIDRDRMVIFLSRIPGDKQARQAREYFDDLGYRVLEGCIENRASYGEAMDNGLAVTETYYDSLNERAGALVEDLIELVSQALNDPDAADKKPKARKPRARAAS